MMLKGNFNFVASGTVNKNDAVTFDASGSSAQKLACKQAGSSDAVIGFAACAAAAGEVVDLLPLEFGQVFVATASASFSAGAQLGISSGKVAGSGALPLFAIDAATASGDKVRVICAAALDANT